MSGGHPLARTEVERRPEKMCEAVEKYAEDVRLNSLLESIKNLMANMKLGAEQAMNILEISDKDREILRKEL